jgi:DNA-binding LytR/AlgR family response regulator
MPDKKIICLAVDDEPPALEVLKNYIGSVHSLELAGTCIDAVEALDMLQKRPVDLLFLDIQMPQILGTDFIRTLKHPPKIIFTTAFRKYAVEGFELNAVDYLLKPISFERFLKAVNKVMETSLQSTGSAAAEPEKKKEHTELFICFRADRRVIKILLNDILYIESLRDYIKVVTATQNIVTKQSISSVEESLPRENFIRIHRSFIVAINKINSYNTETVGIGKNQLPISRFFRHEVGKLLNGSAINARNGNP